MAHTPTVNRHQLGGVLREHRINAGLSQQELAPQAFRRVRRRHAQNKLAWVENGDRSLHESELVALQDELGITDKDIRAQMMRMLEKSSQRTRWRGDRSVYHESYRKFIDLEEDADLIREVSTGKMPDLLMCENYIRTHLDERVETKSYERHVRAALARTTLLREDKGKTFHFILFESAIRIAPKANRAVVREQISHVIRLLHQENIKVQVVPFIQPYNVNLYEFTCLHIPTEGIAREFEYVHIGAPDGRRYLNQPEIIDVYDRHFSEATHAGLGGKDAQRFLEEIDLEYK